jgi:hypothetical protein
MLACFAPGAEPLKIGMVATFSGPGADSGRYQIQGTELAIDEVNKGGGVLGRQIELIMEDDQTPTQAGCGPLGNSLRKRTFPPLSALSAASRSMPSRRTSKSSASQ